jgi:hypothetical protein
MRQMKQFFSVGVCARLAKRGCSFRQDEGNPTGCAPERLLKNLGTCHSDAECNEAEESRYFIRINL